MKRAISAAAVAVLMAACGTHEESGYRRVAPDAPGSFALPEPKPATPSFALVDGGSLTRSELARIRKVDEVVEAAHLRIAELDVEGPEGTLSLQVATTKPLRFRSVAPDPTKEAEFVWTSLIGGRAVITYEAAERLGVDGADPLALPGAGEVLVGAFAENGAPSNFADVLVAEHVLGDLPEAMDVVVVGTSEGSDPAGVARALQDALPDARLLPLIKVLAPGSEAADTEEPLPMGRAELGLGGTMNFQILDSGWIRPDPAWVEANIVKAPVPILGSVVCHRVMVPQLAAALGEIEQAGLALAIRPENYAGCYAPRFIDRNPDLPLSNHAFGLAIDLNSDTNTLGTLGDMDPRVVEIFEKWGFEWGGGWDRPDPMHFELARLLQT